MVARSVSSGSSQPHWCDHHIMPQSRYERYPSCTENCTGEASVGNKDKPSRNFFSYGGWQRDSEDLTMKVTWFLLRSGKLEKQPAPFTWSVQRSHDPVHHRLPRPADAVIADSGYPWPILWDRWSSLSEALVRSVSRRSQRWSDNPLRW